MSEDYRAVKIGARFREPGEGEREGAVWVVVAEKGGIWELNRNVAPDHSAAHRFLFLAADDLSSWEFVFPPCVDCGEPEAGSCPESRCRDCDIEHCFASGSCRECHAWIMREEYGGPIAEQHAAGCSLRASDDWRPRNEQEVRAVRLARGGWAPEAQA